jgi:hypothetical protein
MQNPNDPFADNDARRRVEFMLERRELELEHQQFKGSLPDDAAAELDAVRRIKLDVWTGHQPSPFQLDKLPPELRSRMAGELPWIDPFAPPLPWKPGRFDGDWP